MDLESLVVELGGVGLMLIAFVAATIVPVGSEAAFVAAIALGLPKVEALVWASVGNCLGVTLNYWMGRLGRRRLDPDQSADAEGPGSTASSAGRPRSRRAAARALRWLERYGKWGLLLSWLPIIGDPLTLVAGVSRVNFLFFVVVAYAVRVLRYWAIALAMPG